MAATSTAATRTASTRPRVDGLAAVALLAVASVPMLRLQVGGGLTAADVLLALACAGALVRGLAPGRHRLVVPLPWAAGALLVVVGAAVLGMSTGSPYAHLVVAARLVAYVLVVLPTAASLVTTPDHLATVVRAYLLGTCVSSAEAVRQVALRDFPVVGFSGRAVGLTSHPNDLGATVAVGLVMAVALLTAPRGSRRRPAFVVTSSVLMATALIASGSVTSMLSVTAGVLVVLVVRRPPTRQLLAGGLVLAAAVTVGHLVQQALERSGFRNLDPLSRLRQTTGGGTLGENTLLSRGETYTAALERISAHPWSGTGLDTASGQLEGTGLQVHNALLLAWYQGGPAVALGLSLVALCALVWAWRVRHDDVGLAVLGAVVVVLVYAMTGPVLLHRWFWLVLVLAAVAVQVLPLRSARGREALLTGPRQAVPGHRRGRRRP